MSPKKTTQPNQAYLSRADLMKQVATLTRQLERQRKALQDSRATRAADAEPQPRNRAAQQQQSDDDDSDPQQDDDSLPEVPEEGLPFRPQQRNGQPQTASIERAFRAMFSGANGSGVITIHPSAYVRGLFARQRRGLGGFQSLHAALQHRMGGTRELTLTAADFKRIVNYAVNYGEGGFQQSLRWLVAQAVAEQMGVTKQQQNGSL
jgi:hypothetical protein